VMFDSTHLHLVSGDDLPELHSNELIRVVQSLQCAASAAKAPRQEYSRLPTARVRSSLQCLLVLMHFSREGDCWEDLIGCSFTSGIGVQSLSANVWDRPLQSFVVASAASSTPLRNLIIIVNHVSGKNHYKRISETRLTAV
jgi:hypothetical protein